MDKLEIIRAMNQNFRLKTIGLLGPMIYPSETRRWVEFLKNKEPLWELSKSYPRLLHKIYRPYVAKYMTCSDRVRVLRNHYSLMVDSGFSELVRKSGICPQNVCTFFGKNETKFELEIVGVSFDREGELNLRLISEGVHLYQASFVFHVQDNEYFIKVGSLQGMRSSDGALLVKSMTRDLHGCRPKNLMASVVRDIGDYFGCKTMVMVSNMNRVIHSKLKFWRRTKITADYDQTWVEMGAIKRLDGNYELPCTDILKTNFDDTPSRKRSEAKKRNMLLASIFQDVRRNLDMARSTDNIAVNGVDAHDQTVGKYDALNNSQFEPYKKIS